MITPKSRIRGGAGATAPRTTYTAIDLHIRYGLSKRWEAVVSVENLFNAEIEEAQTYLASRLPFEAAEVGDNHFSPGNPFTLRLGVQYRF